MLFFKKDKEKSNKKKEAYERVYRLHEEASFLFYIDDVYFEKYNGKDCVKLEGTMAKGSGTVEDTFYLYSCQGRKKATITIDEFYIENNKVEQLEAGDKRIAVYPKEQDINYKAGDMLCKLKSDE